MSRHDNLGKDTGGGEMYERQSWPIEPAHRIRHGGFPRRQRTVKHLPFQKNEGWLEAHLAYFRRFFFISKETSGGGVPPRRSPTLYWAPKMGGRANLPSPEAPHLYPRGGLDGRGESRRWNPAPSRASSRAMSKSKTAPSQAGIHSQSNRLAFFPSTLSHRSLNHSCPLFSLRG